MLSPVVATAAAAGVGLEIVLVTAGIGSITGMAGLGVSHFEIQDLIKKSESELDAAQVKGTNTSRSAETRPAGSATHSGTQTGSGAGTSR